MNNKQKNIFNTIEATTTPSNADYIELKNIKEFLRKEKERKVGE